VLRILSCDWIVKEQPPETPLDAWRVFTVRFLKGGTVSSVGELTVEEACYLAEYRTKNWLNFKSLHIVSIAPELDAVDGGSLVKC
jgi:hypothetical protein